jgi:hypothetical protein
MKRLTIFAITVTAIWVSGCAAIVFLKWDSALSLQLNAWGVFLGTLTAPLALFWLVIGYFQQGEELRLNTKALQAQQEALMRRMAETALLPKYSEQQAKASELLEPLNKQEAGKGKSRERMAAQPRFFAKGGRQSGRSIETTVENSGAEILEISISSTAPHGMSVSPIKLWKRGQRGTVTITQKEGISLEWPIPFSITYKDSRGQRYTRRYQFTNAHEFEESNS